MAVISQGLEQKMKACPNVAEMTMTCCMSVQFDKSTSMIHTAACKSTSDIMPPCSNAKKLDSNWFIAFLILERSLLSPETLQLFVN